MVGIAVSNPSNGMAVRPLRLLCIVYVSASATSRSLFQRSPTGCVYMCVCLILCHVEMSTVRRPGPKLGSGVTETKAL